MQYVAAEHDAKFIIPTTISTRMAFNLLVFSVGEAMTGKCERALQSCMAYKRGVVGMNWEEHERKSFSKEDIFSALDSLLEAGPLNLYGITLEMPVAFHITHESARELFREWAETVMRRYRKIVDSNGNILFKLKGATDSGEAKEAPGIGAMTGARAGAGSSNASVMRGVVTPAKLVLEKSGSRSPALKSFNAGFRLPPE